MMVDDVSLLVVRDRRPRARHPVAREPERRARGELGGDRALQILRERYAKGEIGKEEVRSEEARSHMTGDVGRRVSETMEILAPAAKVTER